MALNTARKKIANARKAYEKQLKTIGIYPDGTCEITEGEED